MLLFYFCGFRVCVVLLLLLLGVIVVLYCCFCCCCCFGIAVLVFLFIYYILCAVSWSKLFLQCTVVIYWSGQLGHRLTDWRLLGLKSVLVTKATATVSSCKKHFSHWRVSIQDPPGLRATVTLGLYYESCFENMRYLMGCSLTCERDDAKNRLLPRHRFHMSHLRTALEWTATTSIHFSLIKLNLSPPSWRIRHLDGVLMVPASIRTSIEERSPSQLNWLMELCKTSP